MLAALFNIVVSLSLGVAGEVGVAGGGDELVNDDDNIGNKGKSLRDSLLFSRRCFNHLTSSITSTSSSSIIATPIIPAVKQRCRRNYSRI